MPRRAFRTRIAPAVGHRDADAMTSTLRSGWLSREPRVDKLERAFAEYIGAPHAVAVNSRAAAVHLSLLAAGIRPGDEIVTTPLMPCSTANVIAHSGATLCFVDVDPVTFNLTAESAASAVTPQTRALMPIREAGCPVSLEGFRALAQRRGLIVIEDAAQAIDAKSSCAADLTCFTFSGAGSLPTDDGGMLTTMSAESAAIARGACRKSPFAVFRHAAGAAEGATYRMPVLQAVAAVQQMAGLDAALERREAIWRQYDAAFADLPVGCPELASGGAGHARRQYTLLIGPDSGWTRDDLAAALESEGIQPQPPRRAVHLDPLHAERFKLRRGMFPAAERLLDRGLSLPLYGDLTDADANQVIDAVRRLVRRAS